jgi:hypothetical protein
MPSKGGAAEAAPTMRRNVHLFLEGKTTAGFYFTLVTVALILVNIVGFVMSTVKGYDASFYEQVEMLEQYSVLAFTVEYLLRLWSSADDVEHKMIRSSSGKVDEFVSRLSWATSFYSLVDLASILPFYFEMYSLTLTKAACKGEGVVIDLPASQFVRIFRLLRVMRLDGKYLEAFTVFDDIYREQKEMIFKCGFVGSAVWVILSGANWWAERQNSAMEGKMDTIGKASFYTLCNLFGEFPLVNERTPAGKVIAVCTSVVSACVFGIVCGIFGSAFSEHANKKREEKDVENADKESEPILQDGQLQSMVWNLVHGENALGAWYEKLMLLLIVANCSGFIYGSQAHVATNTQIGTLLDGLEDVCVLVFTIDYILRLYAAGCHAEYSGLGRWRYVTRFYPLVDLAAIGPSLLTLLAPALGLSVPDVNTSFIRALRLLRVLKAESFFKSGGFFTIVDDIIYEQRDVLTVTGFCAMVLWVFFSSIMYLLEKDNPLLATPDGDHYYKSIPAAMWPTLLNLSGEVPLADFTVAGRIVCGIMGIIAVELFAIPVGIVGDGFQGWAEDNLEKEQDDEQAPPVAKMELAKGFLGSIYNFAEGRNVLGGWYESLLFYLVFATGV